MTFPAILNDSPKIPSNDSAVRDHPHVQKMVVVPFYLFPCNMLSNKTR